MEEKKALVAEISEVGKAPFPLVRMALRKVLRIGDVLPFLKAQYRYELFKQKLALRLMTL